MFPATGSEIIHILNMYADLKTNEDGGETVGESQEKVAMGAGCRGEGGMDG